MGENAEEFSLEEAMAMAGDDKDALDKVIELLLDPRNIKHLSELSQKEIAAFSLLSPLANKHKLTTLQEIILERMLLKVSKSRAGRKDIASVIARQLEQDEFGADRMGRFARWGRRRQE